VTTVVALADQGGAWMAADTCTNIYDRPIRGWARKVMRLVTEDGCEVLFGVSGNAGMASKVRQAWGAGFPAPPGDPGEQQAWADDIAAALTVPMVEAGMVDDVGQLDGHFLLAFPGAVWTLQHHLAILSPDGRAAVGTGEGVAMGALDALLSVDVAPVRAVTRAAEIAVSRDRWSGLPLQVEAIELPVPAA
jgi:ATP-dependent protease HslVU (ClpYQ) peptidase subunit